MWMAMKLHTSLSINECLSRLAFAIDAEKRSLSWSGYKGSRPILGKIYGDQFRLRKRIYYRNDLQPFFYGQFVPSENGTLIDGNFRMHPFTKWFMIYWFAFLAFFLVVDALAPLIFGPANVNDSIVIALFSLVMMCFGIFIMVFSTWLCRGHKKVIVDLLMQSLEAREIEKETNS
jgi:hypothetical protein